jgi:hypothetical protein
MSEQEQSEQEAEDADEVEQEPEADIDESDHAEGADIFGDVDPDDLDADLDEDTDDEAEEADDSSTPDATADEQSSASPADMADVSLGHVYCRGLGVASALAVDRCSADDDRDREAIIEEYSALAKQMEIDQYVDQHIEQSGGVDALSPGQAAVLMTGAMVVMVAVSEPAVTDSAMNSLGDVDLGIDQFSL